MSPVDVDAYLAEGCGRCDRYQTPDCKVHRWQELLVALRALARAAGLREEVKWGSPCYSLDGKNVLMVAAYNEFACISFFKGTLLEDEADLLESPGPNSQAVRLVKFTSLAAFAAHRAAVVALVEQAMGLARTGARVVFAPAPEPVPDELQAVLDADPELAESFAALTPGRQRSHVLHVAGAKQEASRRSRAEKCAEKIRAGKGFLDR